MKLVIYETGPSNYRIVLQTPQILESKSEWEDVAKNYNCQIVEISDPIDLGAFDILLVRGSIEFFRSYSSYKRPNLPGIYFPYNRNLHSDVYYQKIIGPEVNYNDILNYHYKKATVADLKKFWFYLIDQKIVFIRPISPFKEFTGMHFTSTEFGRLEFNDMVSRFKIKGSTRVQICYSRRIEKEWRYVIINREVITSSLYKDGDEVVSLLDSDPNAELLANKVARSKWQPDICYTVDIAKMKDNENSYKIVELNSLSSAGLYDCDKNKILEALINLKESSNERR